MRDKWIEMFRAGTQTDSAGNTKEWTCQDLDKIVAQYNGGDHEAPIVVGHPDSNAPAFGWVEALKREGKLLYAKLKDVMPEFEELVKAGTYKKRSISLYPDLTLRHIGFLGGMPPAVKGLANIFKEGEEAITYEFSDWRMSALGRVIMRMRDYLIEKEGADKADGIISSGDIQDILTPPPEPEDITGTCYNEPHEEESMKPEEVEQVVATAVAAATKQFGETIKGLETRITELGCDMAAAKESGLEREFREFLMTPEMQKRVNVGSREATVKQMMTLVGADPVMFEEAGERKTMSAVDEYKAQLKALPEVVQFGEFATKDTAGDVTVNGMSVETLSLKAVEFQEAEARAGRTISMTAAVNHVKTGGK